MSSAEETTSTSGHPGFDRPASQDPSKGAHRFLSSGDPSWFSTMGHHLLLRARARRGGGSHPWWLIRAGGAATGSPGHTAKCRPVTVVGSRPSGRWQKKSRIRGGGSHADASAGLLPTTVTSRRWARNRGCRGSAAEPGSTTEGTYLTTASSGPSRRRPIIRSRNGGRERRRYAPWRGSCDAGRSK